MPIILGTIDVIAKHLKRVIFSDTVKRPERPSRSRPDVTDATAWLSAEGIG
jgi:hypothetical protein